MAALILGSQPSEVCNKETGQAEFSFCCIEGSIHKWILPTTAELRGSQQAVEASSKNLGGSEGGADEEPSVPGTAMNLVPFLQSTKFYTLIIGARRGPSTAGLA